MGRKKRKKRKSVRAEAVEIGKVGVMPGVPDTEVIKRPTRRRFSAAYKLRILEAADAAKDEPGKLGALLRREGLYSSHLSKWREARRGGELAGLAPRPRGPKPSEAVAQAGEVKRLEREVARLRKELEQAHVIIDVQKKLSTMLGIEMPKVEDDG